MGVSPGEESRFDSVASQTIEAQPVFGQIKPSQRPGASRAEPQSREKTWRILRDHFGLNGERRDEAARTFVGRLFRVAFAALHAPAYQAEHKSALSADWAHLPIPRDPKLFDRLVAVGETVSRLLDATRDVSADIESVIGAARAHALGPLKRTDGHQLQQDDLKVTVTYWGGGKGKWKPRGFVTEEVPADEYAEGWGGRTGDLYLNEDAFFANVPERVWTYQLGGYPVLKKWLSYRQADRRIYEDFAEAASLSGRHEFSPRDRLAVGTS